MLPCGAPAADPQSRETAGSAQIRTRVPPQSAPPPCPSTGPCRYRFLKLELLIRDTLGEEHFLLGCGAPLPPAVGFFDAVRISHRMLAIDPVTRIAERKDRSKEPAGQKTAIQAA
jgi:hypothetical protein